VRVRVEEGKKEDLMLGQRCFRIGCVSMFAIAITGGFTGRAASAQAFSTDAARAGAQASPELVAALSKDTGASPEQAAGAAGALFGVAKSKLAPDQFSQVAKAVPGMDLLLKAAPAAGGATGTAGVASQLGGSAGNLAAAAAAFSKMGLKPELVAKMVPILTSFVTKSGGANVGSLLASVLK
jgi:hypothetical protein